MYFTKYPYRANSSFARSYDSVSGEIQVGKHRCLTTVEEYQGNVYHVRVSNPELWSGNLCLDSLTVPAAADETNTTVSESFGLEIRDADGELLISGVPGEAFGVSGEASMFQFTMSGETRFYGMGQKTFGKMELSGYRTKFWNTDVWGDFHFAQWGGYPTDPPYFSLPYVVVKVGVTYIGILSHNSYPAFMETPGTDSSRVFVEWQRTSPHLVIGNEGGEPNLWIIVGPTLAELTRKFQSLVGTTPLPPAWSLGYHQSRWGYGGHQDVTRLDREFAKHQIPCDAIWLDLDYMDGFRIFQTSKEMFPNTAHETVEALAANDRKIVPILDPGVKFESGYRVYDDGHKADIFCKNAEGNEYVGLVWPGETVFPDFTTEEARNWWAKFVKEFAEEGYAGTWCDMNDPSTGPVDPQGMLFRNGKDAHAAHHNQFSLGMQMASRQGFLDARPNERPFLLSRSGTIGTSRYSAIWSGDSVANWFYLSNSITCAVGMSISGQPFNGNDLGGFGGDTTDELMIEWTKANFLFPFLRNHANNGTRLQEPFSYCTKTMSTIRRYIRLRYKLLPYLYNLFIDQEATGDPILRPVFYHFDDAGLDQLDDHFMVGKFILQAPFVTEGDTTKLVTLPGQLPWYDATNGTWVEPGQKKVKRGHDTTPLFIQAGAILPMRPGTPTTNQKDFRDLLFHVFVPEDWNGSSRITYSADDGLTFNYQNGERTTVVVEMVVADGNVALRTETLANGFGEIEPKFVIHGSAKSVRLNGSEVTLTGNKVTLTGKALNVLA